MEIRYLGNVLGSGERGTDGFSPIISVTEIEGGYHISITDAEGQKSFDVLNDNTGEVYSSEESVIGIWIDGRPIYRKVVDFITGNNNSTTVICKIDFLDKLINCKIVIITSSNYLYILPDRYTSVGLNQVKEIILEIANATTFAHMAATAIIEYTKTTD